MEEEDEEKKWKEQEGRVRKRKGERVNKETEKIDRRKEREKGK